MKKLHEKSLVYRTSHISFMSNYFTVILAIVVFLLLLPNMKQFTFFPKTVNEYLPTLTTLTFFILIAALLEQPSMERWMRHYIITNNEIIKVEGILTKRRITIPFQSVSDVRVEKGVIGRIFNFGTVHVTGLGKDNSIVMKGMRNPEEIYHIVQNKISLMRKFVIKRKSY